MSDSNRGQSAAAVVAIAALLLVFAAAGVGLLVWQRSKSQVLLASEAALRAAAAEQQAAAPRDHSHNSRTHASLVTIKPASTLDTVPEPAETPEQIITALMASQQAAWNAGDLESFMKVYWHSDNLTFCSSGKTTRGWQATLDNYKAKYSTKEKMGQLKFDQLEFTPLAEAVILVLGRWHLDRGDNSVGGNYSLVWQKLNGQWLIVHDHSSSLEK